MTESSQPDSFDPGSQYRPRLLRWSADHEPWSSPIIDNPDEVVVWLVDLDGVDAETEDPPIEAWFGDVLNAEELVRAKRLIRPRDRIRFARCRVALRSILGRIQGVPPARVSFGTGRYGKPFLESSSASETGRVVEFNVSHSGGLALVAVSPRRPLGVDLERIRSISEVERIVSSFFTAAEQDKFASIDSAIRDAAFMRGWTRKESILKGTGKGLAGGASRYETLFGTTPLSREFAPVSPSPIVAGWMLWEVGIEEGYVATLAVATDPIVEIERRVSSS